MAREDTLPPESHMNAYFRPGDYMDVFSGELALRADLIGCDIREFAAHFTTIDMSWAQALLKLRDRIVRPLGLKSTKNLAASAKPKPLLETQTGDRITFLKIYRVLEDEILLGEDDRHQDFRLSVYRAKYPSPRVYLATCCKRHNAFGHAYLQMILPFHKLLVKQSIDSGLQRPLAIAE